MQFCPDCRNMLYLKVQEDEPTPRLLNFCRNCGYSTDTLPQGSERVLHTVLRSDEAKCTYQLNEYTARDPTLPRTTLLECPNAECPTQADTSTQNEVVYARCDDASLSYAYQCIHCDHIWTTQQQN